MLSMRHNGSPPFGFKRVDGKLVEDDEQQLIITSIRRRMGRGDSMAEIAEHLNTNGVKGPRGGTWTRQYISRLLKANPQAET